MALIIKVEGEIICNDNTSQHAIGWTCGSVGDKGKIIDNYVIRDISDRNTFNICSNLVLGKHRKVFPYAIYYTDKGIQGSHITAHGSPISASLAYYNDSIKEIKQSIINPTINTNVDCLNGLYMGVFSALELLLFNLLFSIISCNENAKNNAEIFCKTCSITSIHSYLGKKVYHNFTNVDNIYKKITGINIPNHTALRDKVYKRHNIVHRSALSNLDYMSITNATIKDVEILIKESDEFVTLILKNVKEAYPAL